MRILHLMIGKEKFTKGVVDLYNENFDNGEHEICYLIIEGQPTCFRNDISIPQYEICLTKSDFGGIKYNMDIISLMKNYDFVVLHSFCISNVLILYLFSHVKYCKQHIIWIEWGFDLYDFQLQEKPSLKNRISYHIKKQVRNNVNSVICIFPPDRDYFKNRFPKSKARILYAPYISDKTSTGVYKYQPTISRLKETKENSEPIYIQIGHNAQKQLNHLKALEVLSKFKDENIKLVLPLSYCADQPYIDQISKYLEDVFPNKYIILKDFIPKEEYFRIVRRIDIAIFYTYRQTALSNIYEMINNNVKLFMPEGSVMKDYFSSLGIPIGSIESIQNIDFEQFTSNIEWEKISGPKEFIDRLNDYDRQLKYWTDIYDELRSKNEQ